MTARDLDIQSAAAAFFAGETIILMDDVGAGTGVLACAPSAASAERVNDFCQHGRGLVCLAITPARARALALPLQSEATAGPAYTVSIEAARGVTTGISAGDRARTIEVVMDSRSGPADLVCPGHLFPVQAHPSGLLVRRTPAEAVVDLARIAGLSEPGGAFCHILSADGEAASPSELRALSERLALPMLRMSALVDHRTRHETLVEHIESTEVDTRWGAFRMCVWEERLSGQRHLLLRHGELRDGGDVPLVRVHSQCLTGDVFHSLRCDCGAQLDVAMRAVVEAGVGAVLYLRQEGRGIGLVAKLQAYALQDRGRDTVEANEELGFEADQRDYAVGAQILYRAGYRSLRLMTNNPRKIRGLEAAGLTVVERVAIECAPRPENLAYLKAKRHKLGHLLTGLD